jgi:3-hydroxyisobutyrate dehydrogenase-like beta-hydroxyacid dehydrogenase
VSANPDRTVALAGLGNLGKSIGLHLLERGWDLSVLDKNQDRVDELVGHGAEAVDAAGLAAAANILFVVPDDTAISAILDAGLLTELSARHTVLVISTVLPERTKQLAARVEQTGADYLDLPISGGAERARNGELTLFVGGSADAVSAADALLTDLGEHRFVMGEAGTASATKLAHQLILFSTLAGVYEALRLTGALGIDDDAVLEAVNSGLAESWVGRNWGFYDRLNDEYDEADVPPDDRPWAKDLREAVETAAAEGVEAPLAGLLAGILPKAVAEHAAATHPEGALR